MNEISYTKTTTNIKLLKIGVLTQTQGYFNRKVHARPGHYGYDDKIQYYLESDLKF
jgi:hypothetical protein